MKVGILTFHRADNYGAVLQAYALANTINKLGIDVEIIDYRCKAIENDYIYKVFVPIRKNLLKWVYELLIRSRKSRRLLEKKHKFSKFRDDYFKMSRSVSSIEDRKEIEKDYDLIITGSDQIWSRKLTLGTDYWYIFNKSTNVSVVSYGASVGNLSEFMNNLDDVREILKSYDFISVRENDAQKALSNELNRQVYKVLDPTLLMDTSDWTSIASDYYTKSKYVLYYDVEHNPISKEIACKLAAEKNMKLIHFNLRMRGLNKIYAENAGPLEFLGLIKNASYIVTSSFHATVFSVLFKKNFITVPHPKTGERVKTLLKDFGLEDRIIEDSTRQKIEVIDSTIDYKTVDEKINDLKSTSYEYIHMCVDNVTKN